MSASPAQTNLKVDIFMPLYIGRYLQDTSHLDAMKSGAYLHLLMYIWVRGPLPNEPETLATIARLTPDAWSMSQASLMQFFFLGSDGMLHQRGAERLKDQWVLKRQKAREKAIKAANARWGKHKAKRSEIQAKAGDAPSIARAIPEQCPISVIQEQKQIQPPPTPSASRRGIDAPSTAHGSVGARRKATAPSSPNRRVADRKSEGRAKPPKKPPERIGRNGKAVSPVAVPIASVAGHQTGRNGASENGSDHANGHRRRAVFAREVLAYWRGQNPKHPKCPWSKADDRALDALLQVNPEMTIDTFRGLLQARAHSDVNPAALPYKWLRTVLQYTAGPLGPYGKPLAQARSF